MTLFQFIWLRLDDMANLKENVFTCHPELVDRA